MLPPHGAWVTEAMSGETDAPLDQAAVTNRRHPSGSSAGSDPDVKAGWEVSMWAEEHWR